jgi:hypothetical protein
MESETRTIGGVLDGVAGGAIASLKRRATRVLAGVVSSASTAYHGRWYYANRWHPHNALLQDALDETVAYIKAHMSEALVRRDAEQVLAHAGSQVTLDGLFLEFGVHSGTTINQIARRHRRRTVHGFDSFQGLPEPWSGWTLDRGAFSAGGVPEVESNVRLHVGWFEQTLPEFLEEHPGEVALVHVDSDIYSSARTVLTALTPRIVPGTVIVFNEYFNYPNWKQHEYRAFQEFCRANGVEYRYLCWGMYEVALVITSIDHRPHDAPPRDGGSGDRDGVVT